MNLLYDFSVENKLASIARLDFDPDEQQEIKLILNLVAIELGNVYTQAKRSKDLRIHYFLYDMLLGAFKEDTITLDKFLAPYQNPSKPNLRLVVNSLAYSLKKIHSTRMRYKKSNTESIKAEYITACFDGCLELQHVAKQKVKYDVLLAVSGYELELNHNIQAKLPLPQKLDKDIVRVRNIIKAR